MPLFATRQILIALAICTIIGGFVFSNRQATPSSEGVLPDASIAKPFPLVKPRVDTFIPSTDGEETKISATIPKLPQPKTYEELKEEYSFLIPETQKRPPLTKEEIFRIQHPSFYINYLGTIENLMIDDGFLRSEEREVFDSEAKILSFWKDKGFDYFAGKGILSSSERTRFEHGIEEVRRFHGQEIYFLEQFYGRDSAARVPEAPLGATPRWIQSLASLLVNSFRAARVNAQIACNQDGVSSPAPGIDLVAPCCDCDVDGVPVGCLNLVCEGQAAIFDQTLFICGCG